MASDESVGAMAGFLDKMASLTPIKLFIVLSAVSLSCLLSSPFIVEAILSVCDLVGLSRARESRLAELLMRMSMKISDRSEFLVVAAVYAGIASGVYFHVTEFTVAVHEDATSHLVLFHVLPSVIINANVLYFFTQAIRKDAGRAKPGTSMRGHTKFCTLCRATQPARSHHCATCDTCIVDMDHHCLFTANCVGRDNYPFFFGFILWIWILTLYAVWLCYHPYYHCHTEAGTADTVLCPKGHNKAPLFMLSLSLAVLMTVFLGIIVWLLVSGQTLRTLLGDDEASDESPLAAHAKRGWRFCAEFRLGPVGEWWRYLVPCTLGERSLLADTTVL